MKIILIIIGSTFISLIILSLAGNFLFNIKVAGEVKKLFEQKRTGKAEIVTEQDLEGLPEPVQKWLKQANIVGREKTFAVRLRQKGLIRTTKKQPWMPAQAEQYFTVDRPGFVWKVRVKVNLFLFLVSRDNISREKAICLSNYLLL